MKPKSRLNPSIQVLILSVFSPVALAAPLTIQIPAATMSTIVSELSSKTGEVHEVVPIIAGEVLHLAIRDQSPEVVRKQIASILRSDWKKTAKGWRLVPNDKAWRELRESQRAKDAQALETALAERVQSMPKALTVEDLQRLADLQRAVQQGNAPSGDWVATLRTMNGLAPGSRAAVRCMEAVDLAQLVSMPPGTRRVFSSSPTQMQFGLRSAYRQVAASAMTEFALYETNTPRTAQIEQFSMEMGGVLFSSPTPLSAQGPITDIQVCVTRPRESLNFNITVTAFNAKNQVVFAGAESLGLGEGRKKGSWDLAFPPLGGGNSVIKFSSDAISSMQAMQRSRSGEGIGFSSRRYFRESGPPIELGMPFLDGTSGAMSLSDELREKLVRPDLHDPLSYHVAESIAYLVGDPHRSVIALLPDALAQQIAPSVSEASSYELIKRDWVNAGMVQSTNDGWVVVEPNRIPECLDSRTSRQDLTNVLSELKRTGFWGLDVKASFFARRPRMTPTNFDLAIVGSLYPSANMIAIPSDENRDFLRLWGRLSHAERRTLLNGGELPLRSFATDAREVIGNIVFDSASGPMRTQTEGQMNPGSGSESLDTERTEVLGKGIPSNGGLRLKVENEPGAIARYATGAIRAMGAGTLYTIKMQTSPNSTLHIPNSKSLATVEGYTNAQIDNLSFELILGPQYTMSGRIQDVTVVNPLTYGPYEKLGNDVRAKVNEVAKWMEDLEKALGDPAPPPNGAKKDPFLSTE